MPTPAEIVVHDGADDVAEALAARLTSTLADVQARGRTPQLCLTGGGIATKAYARLAADGPGDVDWSRVDLWWGDERFVPAGTPTGTLTAPSRCCAARCASTTRSCTSCPRPTPAWTWTRPPRRTRASSATRCSTSACSGWDRTGTWRRCSPATPRLRHAGHRDPRARVPQAPPDRISVTLGRDQPVTARSGSASSGAEKAEAVARGVLGTGPDPVPAALASGTEATVWLVDTAAAADLPESVERP